jgi:hypothetical protein
MRNLLFLPLLISFLSFGQNTTDSLQHTLNRYDSYFQSSRESLYLHLNKTSYLRGENLWFQGYAYDRRNQKLSKEVRNIELRVYNDQGEMLKKQLLLALDGRFFGQVEIDSTFSDGNYYLKAETNWMKNFNEDYVHIQKFEVLDSSGENDTQSLSSYDLQLLPEGGHLVRNCKSRLGLKLINQNGLGVEFDAVLLENNTQISTFKSNQFGHAVVNILPDQKADYSVRLTLPNGEIIEKNVTGIKEYGHVLNVTNTLPNQTIVSVYSNLPEDLDFSTESLEIVVHKEGDRFSFPIEYAEGINTMTKAIDKDYLFYGVNTFTLMQNGIPVAERLIFNRSKSINTSESLKVTQIRNSIPDSVTLKVKMPEVYETSYLSMSILPKETIAYQKNKNIISTFLLDPFVNGYIEDRTYYFSEPNREKDYNLDLLLLTQGWSKYSWDNILGLPPQLNYERKLGLQQTITIDENIPNNVESLLLYNTIYNREKVFALDNSTVKTFNLDNRYPFIGEMLEFSFITKKKKFKKPKIVVSTSAEIVSDNLDENYFSPPISLRRQVKLDMDKNRLYSNFLNGELLDEVIIKAKKEESGLEQNYVNSFADNKVKVDEDFVNSYPLLSDYLSFRGYIVRDSGSSFSIRNLSRISLNGSNSPAIFLNGVLLNDLSILAGSRTSDFEEIMIDKSGYGGGLQGANGFIRLTYRLTPLFTNAGDTPLSSPYTQVKIKQGFEPSKAFYNPEYTFYNTEAFQSIGTVGWFPNITLNPGEEFKFNLIDTGLEALTLYIEGITENGDLISIEKEYSSKLNYQEQ